MQIRNFCFPAFHNEPMTKAKKQSRDSEPFSFSSLNEIQGSGFVPSKLYLKF